MQPREDGCTSRLGDGDAVGTAVSSVDKALLDLRLPAAPLAC